MQSAYVARLYAPDSIESDTLDTLESHLENTFGGFTGYLAEGGWEGIKEDTTVYESVDTDRSRAGVVSHITPIAKWLKQTTDEDTVMWEVRETTVGFE